MAVRTVGNVSKRYLCFKAGAAAMAALGERGFSLDMFDVMAGASGGPKWLVLSRLDRVLARHLARRGSRPVHLIGSSIGAWRFTCYGQADPVAAIDRFERAYLAQTYSRRPTAEEVSRETRRIFREFCGDQGAREVLSSAQVRLNIMAVRARGPAAAESRLLQGAALAAAALANLIDRKYLGWFYHRALFADPRSTRRFEQIRGLPIQRIALTRSNLEDAVVASGSIPLVLSGVRNIAGAPAGTYRDGGVTDYHFDSPLGGTDALVFYPHFYPHMIPGWFDKHTGRYAGEAATRQVLLMCPSPGFVERLPYGKIPDREDFARMDDAQRMEYWRRVVAECGRLSDELEGLLESGDLGPVLQGMER